MAYTNCEINISKDNQIYSIAYTFNYSTTFQDLLEYFSYLYPSLKICQCYDFRVMLVDYSYFNVSKNSLLSEYSNYLNNLQLYNDQVNCVHDNHNFLLLSKINIFTTFTKQYHELNNKKNKEINELIGKIKLLNDKKSNGVNEVLNNQNIQIEKLNRKNEELNKEITLLKKEIKDKQNENMLLTQTINGNLGMIKQLKETGLIIRNYEPPTEIIGINETNNQVTVEINNNILKKNEKFYDVVVHIDSIKDITKGWKVDMSPNAEKNYKDYKKEPVLKIGVIGNANKGKSFILSKISKMKFPSGMSIKTEGLSIKYPDINGGFKNRKIALLDSAGLETPVLINEEKDYENKELFKEKSEEKDYENKELFKEKSREKLITELFLQNYIVNNSDILIVVVDSLSFSEQKLLLKVKKEMERAKRKIPLYIIHNLKTFVSENQVEDYIKDTLLKSTFTLEKSHNINTQNDKISDIHSYNEITQDRDQKIVHFIYANESSPAGEKYNGYVLNYIEKSYQDISCLQPFDVIDSIKERYIKVAMDINEKSDKEAIITKDSFETSNPYIIKLKNENEIILKKSLIYELGFSNFKENGFEPKYNIFNKDNKIIVRVEAPGNCNLESRIEIQGEYNVIKLYGEKKKDKEPENLEKNIFNSRELGKYSLEIPLKFAEYHLKTKPPSINYMRGIFILEYELDFYEGKKEDRQFIRDKEKEI